MYAAISANRRRTFVLVLLFVLLAGLAVEAFGIVIGLPLYPASVVAGVASVLAVFAALWAYRTGDSLVLGVSGARPANREGHIELFRAVENLCIGAGVPMPRLYVIDDSAPNAFATGRDPSHASIAVTTGLLDKMERLELEGVLAHELSHIRNFDTRLMMMTAVMIGLIAIMVDVALRMTWFGAGTRRRYKGKGEDAGGAVLLVVAVVLLIAAPILAKLIQMALSREREYLADASGALLTRYPEGLARALGKIAADKEPLEVATKGTAHLYIANPLKGQESALNDLFSTHPAVESRIARLRAMAGM
ncbi:MAG: M48 family metallopeptidase [Chloroflexi bacterium]|nr:M48 family metallopeptidase [Chloroflexota bacterium]